MGAIAIVALNVLYNLILNCLLGTSIPMGRTYTPPMRMQDHVW